MDEIRIRGARTHNLKSVDLDLPRQRLIVITGLSGSGKSSLAFDTLYAEGQRRYVESLSAYARQFLQLMEKPDVDLIEGLSPAIAIEQSASSHNPRSTVGTVTEIHDYLRLLFARVGTPYCPDHKVPLQSQSVSQMVDATLALPEDTKVLVLAPVVRERKGEFIEFFDDMQTQGFVRFRIDGAIVEADSVPPLAKNEKHSLDVVVDRLKVRAGCQAATGRIVRDRAAPGRRPRVAARSRQRPGDRVFEPLRVPGVQLFAGRTRAAALLVQQSDGRVRGVRRHRHGRILRRTARRRASRARAGERRDQGLGRAQPVLPPDAGGGRPALRLRSEPAVRPAAGIGAAGHPARFGRRRDRVYLHQRTRPQDGAPPSVRRRDPESRAALAGNRFAGRARGAVRSCAASAPARCATARACGAKRATSSSARASSSAGSGRSRRHRSPRPRSISRRRLQRREEGDRQQDRQGDRRRGCASSSMSGSTTCRSTARPTRCRAASRSASAWRRRSARA